MVDDLAESLQGAEVLRLDCRRSGKLFLQGGEDLDPLDRIDAEVGVEGHLEFQHLFRVAGLLGDHGEQHVGHPVAVDGRSGWRCGRGRGRSRYRPVGNGGLWQCSLCCSRSLRDRHGGGQRLPLQHTGLLIDQVEEGACGGFLPDQELLVQTRGLLLQVLQGLHALPGHLQGILQGSGGGKRCRRDRRLGPDGRLLKARAWHTRRCRPCSGGRPGVHWRTFLGRLEVVGAGQGDSHARLLAFDPFAGRGITFVPAYQFDRAADRRQLRQGAGQVVNPRAFAAGGIDGDRMVWALAEDRPDHPGQAGTGSNLEESAHPGGVHRFDFGDEIDRTGQLGGENLAGGLGGLGISGTGTVGIDLGDRFLEIYRLQAFAEGPAGTGHQFTVKGRGHRQLLVVEPTFVELPCGFFDLGTRPGKDPLGRGVAVGQDQIQPGRREEVLDLLEGRRDCQHRAAIAFAGGHQFTTQPGKCVQGGGVKVAAGTEGGQLAIAVSGIGVRSHTEGGKHSAGPHADGAKGGLGDFRRPKLRFIQVPGGLVKSGSGVDEFGQAALFATAVGGKGAIRCLEVFQELRELDRQVPEHPGVLRPLAREKHRQTATGLTPGKETAVGGVPGTLPTVAAQHGQGTFHLRRRLGGRLIENHDQAAGLL